MSHIKIAKIHDGREGEPTLLEELKAVTSRIRDKAFAIFQGRGAEGGKALDDWLEAEQSVLYVPESELVEKDGEFRLQIAVPGFTDREIKVTALPESLVVSAESSHHHDAKDGNVHFCEFAEKQVLRRFDLPKAIDVDKVSASLEKGMLRVTAAKAEQAAPASAAAA